MGVGIALRGDFEAADLRCLAKASMDAGQCRRLLALAEIYDCVATIYVDFRSCYRFR